jgi:hypothetical protein
MDNFCEMFGLKNLVNFCTRGSSQLDCIFSTLYSQYSSPIKAAPIGKSDHCTIICRGLPSKVKRLQTTTKKMVHDYSPANRQLFHYLMINTKFSSNDCSTLDEKCEYLMVTILSIHDSCFHLKNVKNYQSTSCPWLTNNIRLLMSKRDMAYRRGHIIIFKHLRNKVKSAINNAKTRYFATLKKLQTKDDWKKAKECLQFSKINTSSNNLTAEDLQCFFSSVYSDKPFSIDFCIDDQPLKPIFIHVDTIKRQLELIRKNGGIPFIPVWIWHNYAAELAPTVTHILQQSVDSGHIPKLFKMVNITPIPKVKIPKLASDYRPIATASPLMKILERIVLKNWLLPLVNEKIFHDQFAFIPLPGRGCQSALSLLYGTILKLINSGSYVDMIMIDLSKAFDCAQSSTILNALHKCGASSDCLHWIFNFITNRQQRVLFNKMASDLCQISSGTPQGSIISPLLFAFLLHDLVPISNQCTYFKYADDITMVYWFSKPNNPNTLLHDEIQSLELWCKNHYMNINTEKTKFLHFSGKRAPQPSIVTVNGMNIQRVDSAKLLGIYICDNLKWNVQIEFCTSMASKRLFNLLQLRRTNATNSVKLAAYEAFVRSILTYCFPCMCNMSAYLKNKLRKVEKRASIIMNVKPSMDISLFCDRMCERFHSDIVEYSFHPMRRLLIVSDRCSARRSSKCNLVVPTHSSSLIRDSIVKYFL